MDLAFTEKPKLFLKTPRDGAVREMPFIKSKFIKIFHIWQIA